MFFLQLRKLQDELERSRGETASASVRVSSLESQLQQTRATLTSRDTDIQRLQANHTPLAIIIVWVLMQGEVERLKGSEARSDSALQTLRERLRELEGERGGGEAGKMVSELQTEIGRLKKTLSDKVRPQNQCCKHTLCSLQEESQQVLQSQLEVSREEVEDIRQRVTSLEEMVSGHTHTQNTISNYMPITVRRPTLSVD